MPGESTIFTYYGLNVKSVIFATRVVINLKLLLVKLTKRNLQDVLDVLFIYVSSKMLKTLVAIINIYLQANLS